MTGETTWITIGLLGQLMFTGRFLVQWLSSERAGRSVIPLSFWFLSLSGGATLLSYAVYRSDPVFILGQSLGVGIYLRNLQLIFRERRSLPAAEKADVAALSETADCEHPVSIPFSSADEPAADMAGESAGVPGAARDLPAGSGQKRFAA